MDKHVTTDRSNNNENENDSLLSGVSSRKYNNKVSLDYLQQNKNVERLNIIVESVNVKSEINSNCVITQTPPKSINSKNQSYSKSKTKTNTKSESKTK